MRLIFARHGNTFGPDDPVVWVGAREDFPLVEKGLAQATALGRALREANVAPSRIIAGPLLRTRVHAERAACEIDGAPQVEIDARLLEIDYGPWGGKSDAEIIAMGAQAALKGWAEEGLWPATAGWAQSEADMAARVEAFLAELIASAEVLAAPALVVTSNGVLRFVRRALDGVMGADAKVKTGHACVLDLGADGLAITAWNIAPSASAFS